MGEGGYSLDRTIVGIHNLSPSGSGSMHSVIQEIVRKQKQNLAQILLFPTSPLWKGTKSFFYHPCLVY